MKTCGKPPRQLTATDIPAAMAMLKMGLPLNTPVEHREFSPKYQKIADGVMIAAIKFRNHGGKYMEQVIAGIEPEWRDYKAMKKAFAKLRHRYEASQVIPEGDMEAFANAALLRNYLATGIGAWAEIFSKLDAGEQVSMTITKDCPLLFNFPWEEA
jgi:hypothetical protein